MCLITALALLGIVLVLCFLRGTKWPKELQEIVMAFTNNSSERIVLFVGLIGLIVLTIILLIGHLRLKDLIVPHRKMVEICPYCKWSDQILY